MAACCRLIWQTHEYVVSHLSGVITQEHLLLFCAKVRSSSFAYGVDLLWTPPSVVLSLFFLACLLFRRFPFFFCTSSSSSVCFALQVLAINYLQVPGLAQVIVRAVVRATPIVGRRSYKYVGYAMHMLAL